MKRLPALLILIVSFYGGFCQMQRTDGQLPWYKGSITLNDKTVIRGLMQYVASKGIVSFITDKHDPDIRTIYTSNIATMTYHDPLEGTNKKFYSLAFPDETGKEEVFFYEVLKTFKGFAVLSKKDQVETQVASLQHSTTTSKNRFSSRQTLIQQEEFYFVSNEGQLEKCLALSDKKVKIVLYRYREKTTEFMDGSLFPKYLTDHWAAVKRYLNDNHIALNCKENIVAALNYYESLLTQ